MNLSAAELILHAAILRIQQSSPVYRADVLFERVIFDLSDDEIQAVLECCQDLIPAAETYLSEKHKSFVFIKRKEDGNINGLTLNTAIKALLESDSEIRLVAILDELLPFLYRSELKSIVKKIIKVKKLPEPKDLLEVNGDGIRPDLNLRIVYYPRQLKESTYLYTGIFLRGKGEGVPYGHVGSFFSIRQIPDRKPIKFKVNLRSSGEMDFTDDSCNCMVLTNKATKQREIIRLLRLEFIDTGFLLPTISLAVRHYDYDTQQMGAVTSYGFPNCMNEEFSSKKWDAQNLEFYLSAGSSL
jgi:hypothetical protein